MIKPLLDVIKDLLSYLASHLKWLFILGETALLKSDTLLELSATKFDTLWIAQAPSMQGPVYKHGKRQYFPQKPDILGRQDSKSRGWGHLVL